MNVLRPFAFAALMGLLAGCASGGRLAIPDSAPERVEITWARVEPHLIDFYCDRSRPAMQGAAVVACAVPMGPKCTIYTSKAPSFDTLGHEVLHCYVGNWHD